VGKDVSKLTRKKSRMTTCTRRGQDGGNVTYDHPSGTQQVGCSWSTSGFQKMMAKKEEKKRGRIAKSRRNEGTDTRTAESRVLV
jgi:hypothetical protein